MGHFKRRCPLLRHKKKEREREKERLNLLLYQPLMGRDEDILYTVVKLHWTFIRTGKKVL